MSPAPILFKGSGVALVTPFDEQGIATTVLEQLIEWHIAEGSDAIIVGGTTGEASTLTDEERQTLYRTSVSVADGRIPIIAGTGSNNTAKAVAYAKLAEAAGVDGLLVVTPYYNKCTQQGLYEHFSAIANAVAIPIILYNVPSRTSVNLLPETVLKLSDHPNIVGIKEASGDITQIVELFRILEGKISVYSGNDDHIIPLLALGGHGVISTVANVLPKLTHDLVAAYGQNPSEALAIQFKINPLVKVIFSEVNPIPVKAAVGLLGFEVGDVRLPLTPATETTLNQLKSALMALEVIR